MTNRNEPLATLEHVPDAAAQWALSTERVPVFAVRRPVLDDDGADTGDTELITYTMPAKPNPGFALRYLKMARTMGDAASSWLIETAVGEEGYEALCDDLATYEGNAVALLQQIAQRIQTVAMGGLDGGPKA